VPDLLADQPAGSPGWPARRSCRKAAPRSRRTRRSSGAIRRWSC